MTDDRVRGRFIWHELRTPNPAGARDFYSTALGWKTEGAEPDSPHSTFVASSGPLGGCAAQAPTDVPRWIPFVTVADVDDSFRQAVDLGAGVVVEPTAIEEGGRYAVLTDPQGAAIGVYSAEDFGADRDPSPGEFSWHELATTDSRAALDFYGALFGWALLSEYDMGPMGAYLIFGHGEKQLGGIFNKDDAGMSGEPAWLSYVRVSDLSGTIEKVQSARGSLLTGPMEVPGGDWIAQLLDPHGAAFALHAVAADAKGEAANAARAKKESEKAEAPRAEPAKAERATAKSASRLNAQSTASAITDIWSPAATGGRAEEPTRAAKTTAKKKRSTTKAKAAKSKATKKKASKAKKAGGKTAKKKTAAKKPATKKAGSKTATKKAAKKAASKKAAKKKAAKKTAKKKSSKTSKKTTGGKTSTKKSGAKKAGKKTGAAKKSGKKAAAKKASKKASKKRSNKASPGAGKKSGKKSKARSSESKKAGKKKTGKKARKKSGRR